MGSGLGRRRPFAGALLGLLAGVLVGLASIAQHPLSLWLAALASLALVAGAYMLFGWGSGYFVLMSAVMADAYTTGYGLGRGLVERGPIARFLIGRFWLFWFFLEYILIYYTISLAALKLAPNKEAAVKIREAGLLLASFIIYLAALSNASIAGILVKTLQAWCGGLAG